MNKTITRSQAKNPPGQKPFVYIAICILQALDASAGSIIAFWVVRHYRLSKIVRVRNLTPYLSRIVILRIHKRVKTNE